MHWENYQSQIQEVNLPLLKEKNIQLSVLREDLIHPEISGNKYRKLKYNILEAQRLGYKKIITFGGAFSNHIAATAVSAKLNKLEVLGFIRGEELVDKVNENPTLRFAQSQGMYFKFLSREAYRLKDTDEFLTQLKIDFPDYYIIPEGGTNELAIKGCEEILYEKTSPFDYICCAIGTAGTITGLINSSPENQFVLGFPALKNIDFEEEICKLTPNKRFKIFYNYHFGGYGKINDELVSFINIYKSQTSIPLDPIYTGKMMYGIFDLIKNDYFKPNSKILAVHTGGLQGIEGMNEQLKKKNKNIII